MAFRLVMAVMGLMLLRAKFAGVCHGLLLDFPSSLFFFFVQ